MINRSAKLLQRSYPLPNEGNMPWQTAGIFGVFVGLFLFLFQPFGLAELNHPQKHWYILGYGLVTSFLMVLNVVLMRGSLPAWYQEESWTIGKEIAWGMGNVLVIALANWIYSVWWLNFAWTIDNLLFFVFATFGIGILPMSFLVLWNANRLLRKHLAEARVLQTQQAVLPTIPENKLLLLVADNEKDRLELPVNDLLFMRSADNYVEILYRSGKEVKRALLRATLSRFAKQVEHQPNLMRCHRAFVVNLRRIEGFSGDSQGYKLKMEGSDDQVSVSRRYIPPFRERFASLERKK